MSYQITTDINGSFVCGFSENPTVDVNYSVINYGIYINLSIPNINFIYADAPVDNIPLTDPTATFSIEYDGKNVHFYMNSTIMRSIPRTSNTPMYGTICILTYNYVVRNIHFHQYNE